MWQQVRGALVIGTVAGLLSSLADGQCEVSKVISTQSQPDDDFGSAVSVSADAILVGGDPQGLAYIFSLEGDLEAELVGPSGASFGFAVSIEGTTAMVGAPTDSQQGPNFGSVFVYERLQSGWVMTQKLTLSSPAQNDLFGFSVSLDGSTVVVGAIQLPGLSAGPGRAVVFERLQGGVWTETDGLVPQGAGPTDSLGSAVALSGDTVAIAGLSSSGAYIFERQGSAWVEAQEILSSSPDSLSVDGTTLVAGRSGSAYVYEKQPSGWVETSVLVGAQQDTFFGRAVLTAGQTIAVGEPGNFISGNDIGRVHFYEKGSSGDWVLFSTLAASDGKEDDAFGAALGGRGDNVIVGAPGISFTPPVPGAAYVLSVSEANCPAFLGLPPSLSIESGGSQAQSMHAGQPHAQGLYFVLGSATGTSPGIPADNGLTIPLNLDNYYVFTALYPNTSVLTNSLGFLDAQGKGQASFNIPPGLSPTLAGVTLNHAYVVLDFLSNPPQTVFASNSVPVTFVP